MATAPQTEVRWGPYINSLDCDICGGLLMIREFGPCPFHPLEHVVADMRGRWWEWHRALLVGPMFNPTALHGV